MGEHPTQHKLVAFQAPPLVFHTNLPMPQWMSYNMLPPMQQYAAWLKFNGSDNFFIYYSKLFNHIDGPAWDNGILLHLENTTPKNSELSAAQSKGKSDNDPELELLSSSMNSGKTIRHANKDTDWHEKGMDHAVSKAKVICDNLITSVSWVQSSTSA
eukprot:6738169-Ditylum_brightwellii.AAC.1